MESSGDRFVLKSIQQKMGGYYDVLADKCRYHLATMAALELAEQRKFQTLRISSDLGIIWDE